MGRKILVLLVMIAGIVFSCKNSSDQTRKNDKLAHDAIVQQQDGTISLDVEKADTYHDINNPESNTAEWSVVVSKSGRYNVWLSSATKDTTDLKYNKEVMLSVKDNRIEAIPVVDRVIQNPNDGSYPYRADSFMGSLYIQDTGIVDIQVISEKILPENPGNVSSEATKLLSVSFTPVN